MRAGSRFALAAWFTLTAEAAEAADGTRTLALTLTLNRYAYSYPNPTPNPNQEGRCAPRTTLSSTLCHLPRRRRWLPTRRALTSFESGSNGSLADSLTPNML